MRQLPWITLSTVLFSLINFLLKDNCFTEFCFFLSNLNMNQPQVYIYPFLWNLPPHPLQADTQPLSEFPEPYSNFPLAICFAYGNVSFHVTLSMRLTLSSPLPMSISLFSVSVSPLLPCEYILQDHVSRFRIYALECGIYLSFSDLLHSYNRFQVHPLHQN